MPAAATDRVELLRHDPALAAGLDPELRGQAAGELVAPLLTLEPGRWTPSRVPGPEPLGMLLMDGLIARQVEVANARCVELLGSGDLIRPWQEDAASFVSTRWVVLTQARLAVMSADFTERVCRYPRLVEALLGRATRRSRSLAVHSAIDNVVGLQDSLLLLFWHLAERWGKVTAEGVVMPLNLTHQMLADLVGARRPSVSAALRELVEDGKLTRVDRRGWLLRGPPPSPSPPEA